MTNVMYDVLIIGAGPAGLSAAIYTARAGLKTVLLGILKNSNAYKAHIIENYFGFEKQIGGPFLMEEGLRQARKHGTEFVERETVDIQANSEGAFTVTDTELAVYTAKAVIICSGLGFKPSGIKNEQALIGRGVSFCVTCDGPFFKGKNVAVIGNANFAGEEALQLLSYTPNITILSHGKDFTFGAVMQEGLAKHSIKLLKTPKIAEFILGETKVSPTSSPSFARTRPPSFCSLGPAKPDPHSSGGEVVLRTHPSSQGEGAKFTFDGVFVALGIAGASDFANQLGVLRTGPQNAFIVADSRTGETNVPGIYAAGDCTGGNAQAAKSAGEGCNAAISVIKRLKGIAAYVDYS